MISRSCVGTKVESCNEMMYLRRDCTAIAQQTGEASSSSTCLSTAAIPATSPNFLHQAPPPTSTKTHLAQHPRRVNHIRNATQYVCITSAWSDPGNSPAEQCQVQKRAMHSQIVPKSSSSHAATCHASQHIACKRPPCPAASEAFQHTHNSGGCCRKGSPFRCLLSCARPRPAPLLVLRHRLKVKHPNSACSMQQCPLQALQAICKHPLLGCAGGGVHLQHFRD
jgi:hypothetical protein